MLIWGKMPGRDAARSKFPRLGAWPGRGQPRGQCGLRGAGQREDTVREALPGKGTDHAAALSATVTCGLDFHSPRGGGF